MNPEVFQSNEMWESWIWTELLAFDNTLPDYGVQAYLKHSEHIPYGISLLLMSPDFLLRHHWNPDEFIPADSASRQGHLSNGRRQRQDWTQSQLHSLIKELQKYNIKVIFSIFCNELGNVFHREFISEFCEVPGFNPLLKLKDGRDSGSLFTSKLKEVISDYGFDGWHAGDTIACPWDIGHICYGPDQLFDRFRNEYSITDIPNDLMSTGSDFALWRKRLDWLVASHFEKWSNFLLENWHKFFQDCIDIVHELNGLVVVNSPNTKSVFGALQYMALDYRKLDKMGIDRLVVETNTTSAALLWHKRDYLLEFSAVMAEMSAAMPNTKILMMPCMQDTVECYDAIAHAPGMFERDFFILAAQQIFRNGQYKRCADGVMICLGDALETHHWKMLNNLLNQTADVKTSKSGELVWLLDTNSFDLLRTDHLKYGTWSPSYQVGKIKEFSSIDISAITVPEELDHIDSPLFVPNFHLLKKNTVQKLLDCGKPLVATGDLNRMNLPSSVSGVCLSRQHDYPMGCVLINWSGDSFGIEEISCDEKLEFDPTGKFNLYTECYPRMDIPDEFWRNAALKIRNMLNPTALQNADQSIQQIYQYTTEGKHRYIVLSREWFYQTFFLNVGDSPAEIKVKSNFPVFSVSVNKGYLASRDDIPLRLHVPPQGCCVFEIENKMS